MLKQISAAIGVLMMGAPSAATAYDCEYSKDLNRELNVRDVSELSVDAGAGSLEIIGYDDQDTISIEAREWIASILRSDI